MFFHVKRKPGSETTSGVATVEQLGQMLQAHNILRRKFFFVLSFDYPGESIIAACLIFLTLPMTIATAERSFSKLKLIKTYLRSSMSQYRLSSLDTI